VLLAVCVVETVELLDDVLLPDTEPDSVWPTLLVADTVEEGCGDRLSFVLIDEDDDTLGEPDELPDGDKEPVSE